ncbi:MAG: UDP-N-acetylmuramoyl-tripeptide--D-alanyl-D-alanine ligase [Deltaproteobacteria bacterium]|jgi:UDP-N-acetylmuramoyl-tripeptide--D-alanyl-D-alanine ligase|nr:UDP-N-acetylmuramoyl-tripeptide--D-alanyl-D-alanine ligase [Deltaproteobacteria bacterium]
MTVPFTLKDVVTWTGGQALGRAPAGAFTGAGIDTRTIQAGDLFVAIRGEHHDAHGFLDQAVAAGATGLVVARDWLRANPRSQDVPMVAVEDTTLALGSLAAGHRAQFAGPVVAVTGSNGKTTTKEMIHSILVVRAPCLKNHGNLNNEFGLPLTLLSREREHQAAVVELGMNHRGEIARLTAIAQPDVGVITNVGTAHIEHLGSRENIALEKGDLTAGLSAEGVAVLNHDDPLVRQQSERTPARVMTYGRESAADVFARGVRFEEGGFYAFELITPEASIAVRAAGLAETTVINALAASAAALATGLELDEVACGLAAFGGVSGRMACTQLASGARIIDDTYNANPQSMRNALESLARLKGKGRGIAVLGDMGELGEAASEAHLATGRLAAELGTDFLFALGERAKGFAAGASEAGMDGENIVVGDSHEAVGRHIMEMLESEDWVLVKGSRAMKMEQVIDMLIGKEND